MNKNTTTTSYGLRAMGYGLALSLSACVTDSDLQNSLSQISHAVLGQAETPVTEIDVRSALTEALLVSTGRTINTLADPLGFWDKENVKIPLPESYQRLHTTLAAIGLGKMTDNIQLKLNQAASAAAARAKPIFINAITGLTFEDAYGILQGGNTAATDLLYKRTKEPLTESFVPVVQDALAQVGALQEIENTRRKLASIPFASYLAPQLNQDIASYTVEKTLQGMFKTMAEEETAIRQNPAKRTTDLLRKVFALQG